ncbi:MAG: hypothetical protein JOZ05_05220 [Acetobacteraceae bacterium]|nr:hypothetical protein [Acetobacteraceae bacterium]
MNVTVEPGRRSDGMQSVPDRRALMEDCCGWNRKTWADALEFAVSHLPSDLNGKAVLEIGASPSSTLAPLFSAMGANVVCSCYGPRKADVENGQLRTVCGRYGLRGARILEMDARDIDGKYDVIVMKSVLGGICRSNDYGAIRALISGMIDHLTESGRIITLDNGYLTPLESLRRKVGTGGHTWTYIRKDRLHDALSGFHVTTRGFGLLNFMSAAPMLGTKFEVLNGLLHAADSVIARLVRLEGRAVLATVIARAQA